MDKIRKTKVLLLLLLVSLCGNLIQLCYLGYHYHSTLTAGTYVEERIPSLTRKILALSDNVFFYYTVEEQRPLAQGTYEIKGEDMCVFYDEDGLISGSGVLKRRDALYVIWADGSAIALEKSHSAAVMP